MRGIAEKQGEILGSHEAAFAPLLINEFYGLETERLALMNHEQLVEWLKVCAPFLSGIGNELSEESCRSFCFLALVQLQILSAGNFAVTSDPAAERPRAEISPTKPQTAMDEQSVKSGKLEKHPTTGKPVDEGASWDSMCLKALTFRHYSEEELARALKKRLGEGKSMDRFNNYEVNLRRVQSLVDRLRSKTIRGWKLDTEGGKYKAVRDEESF